MSQRSPSDELRVCIWKSARVWSGGGLRNAVSALSMVFLEMLFLHRWYNQIFPFARVLRGS